MNVKSKKINKNYVVTKIFSRINYKIAYSNKKGGSFLLGIDLLKNEAKNTLLHLTSKKLEKQFHDLIKSKNSFYLLSYKGESLLLLTIKDICEEFLQNLYGFKIKISTERLKNTIYTQQLLTDFKILFQAPFFGLLNFKSPELKALFFPLYNSIPEQFLEALLDNLVIEISNCIVFFTLLYYSTSYLFRQTLYRSKFLSLRSLERFKNNYVWQSRVKSYIQKPKELYENSYRIYILRTKGIYHKTIYANRTNQLRLITDFSLFLVSIIEIRDFIVSRLDELVYIISSSLRFILTSILGQLIGLIWRGIIEGLKR